MCQDALASEVASRMNAMSNATENAQELFKVVMITRNFNLECCRVDQLVMQELSRSYNRKRQGKITQDIAELVAGQYLQHT